MKTLTIAAVALALIACAAQLDAAELHVPTPYATIQVAIDAANAGDEVVVAQGIYTGTGNTGLDFDGKAITVRSTDPSNPDVVDATIIDGGGTTRAVDFTDGEDRDSIVAGFTFTDCYDASGGGAIAIHDASPTISDCVFLGNSAYWSGGAIFCTSYQGVSAPLITACVFDGNTARQGGAIFCTSAVIMNQCPNVSSPEIVDCTFLGNSATGMPGAGGAANLAESNALVSGCTFTGNSADSEGGALTCWGEYCVPDALIQGCTFGSAGHPNTAQKGGALVCKVAYCTITGSTIEFNEASEGGGGLFADGGVLTLKGTTIIANTVMGESADGGGGIYLDEAAATVSGCTVSGNVSATYGGGVRMESSGASLTGCLLEGNSAVDGGGALYVSGGAGAHLEVVNCTIKLNEVTVENPGDNDGRGGGIFCAGNLKVAGCTVDGNVSAGEGGGIYSNFTAVGEDTAFIVETVFAGNVACSNQGYADGGALYIGGGSPVIQNCTLNSNEAADGGGIYILSGGEPTIANCTIGGDTQDDGNTASGSGAGIYIADGTPRIVGCRIKHNRTTANGNGGGIWSLALLTLESCAIAHNSTAGTGNGGGLCVSGSSMIFNCLIVDNTAGANGGGAWCTTDDATFLNCTFNANEAVDGGALYRASAATPTVTNCILWGDTATGPMGVDENGPFPHQYTTTYCDIEGGSLGLGNINDDPLFVSGPNHDYYLSWTEAGQDYDSPCVNVGSVESKDLGLDKFTTRTDERVDTGLFVDLGYHDPGTTAIDDVYWDQATTSTVLTFTTMESLGVDPLEYTVEYADGDEYWSGLGWSELTTVTGMATPTTVTDDLTTNPLAGAFRFYRVRRADGLAYSPETAGVFELPINAAATAVYFISTPLVPDLDHDSVPEVFGEGAARQVPRSGFTVSDLDENSGLISRMYNASGTYTVLSGSAFNIEAGVGYEVYVGTGLQSQFTLRLTGYVPEASITVPLTKQSGQAIRWMGYSMPRTITLSELGLVEAVTLWSTSNTVRLLPPGSGVWYSYQYDTTGGFWYDIRFPATPADPDLVPGMGIVFLRQGLNNLTDQLELPTWYLHPPNIW